jgi:hypothetical protein
VTTYVIRRGFYLLDPRIIDTTEKQMKASLLNGMETPGLGQPLVLENLREQNFKIDILVTYMCNRPRRDQIREMPRFL